MIELISRLICIYAFGYRLSMSEAGILLVDKDGNWDHWRDTSRWTRLLFWHLRGAN